MSDFLDGANTVMDDFEEKGAALRFVDEYPRIVLFTRLFLISAVFFIGFVLGRMLPYWC